MVLSYVKKDLQELFWNLWARIQDRDVQKDYKKSHGTLNKYSTVPVVIINSIFRVWLQVWLQYGNRSPTRMYSSECRTVRPSQIKITKYPRGYLSEIHNWYWSFTSGRSRIVTKANKVGMYNFSKGRILLLNREYGKTNGSPERFWYNHLIPII